MEEHREVIRNIKKELRLFMNGVTSVQQRRLGMEYNIIFGVSIPHLKEIAGKFQKDEEVARTLWKENIRESKLLAIMLLPESCYDDVAEQWIGECRYRENADHLAHNILCRLPDAARKALDWINSPEDLYCYSGYLTLSHLFRAGSTLDPEQEKIFFSTVKRHLATQQNCKAQALNALTLYCADDEEKIRHCNTSAGEELL